MWNKSSASDVYNAIKMTLGEENFADCDVKMAPMLYYYTEDKCAIMQIWFETEGAMFKTKNLLKYPVKVYDDDGYREVQCTVWESEISTILQILCLARFKHCQWFETNSARKVNKHDKISTLENEYIIDCSKMMRFPKGFVAEKVEMVLNPKTKKEDKITVQCFPQNEQGDPVFPIYPVDPNICRNWFVSPRVLCVDGEMYSDNPKAMPIATLKSHACYMISAIFQKVGDVSSRKRYIIIQGDSSKLPEASKDVVVIKVHDEYEIYDALCNIICKHDPEVISGYNILKFDYPYFNTRMELMCKTWPEKASRLLGVNPRLISQKKWSSKAYGEQQNHFLDFPGRISIDLFPIIKRSHRLPKYDLSSVGQKFVKRGKHDIKAPEMFKIYEDLTKYKDLYERCVRTWVKPENLNKVLKLTKGRPGIVPDGSTAENDLGYISIEVPPLIPDSCEGLVPIYHKNINENVIKEVINGYENAKSRMMKVALYCVEDSELVIDIMDKTNTWVGLTELSNIVGVSIVDVFARGQQIRGLSLVYYRCKPKGIVLDTHPANPESKYSGGYVGEPVPGLYNLTMCLDFASLYPSIMQAFNICYRTFVKPTDTSVSPEDCHMIKCPVLDKDGNQVGEVTHRFVKSHIRKGEIPELLEYVVNERRTVKKRMEAEIEGSLEWVIYNEQQLSLKIVANSIYGMMGVTQGGLIPLLEGAECVTSIGREKILFCNKHLEDKHGAKIVYNDTDSTFFTLPDVKDYLTGIRRMNELAKELSDLMLRPMYLEAEKIGRMFAIKKKKYAFWLVDTDKEMWENGIKGSNKVPNPNYGQFKDYKKDKYVILVKGIILARRDNFEYLRNTYWDMLTLIMEKKSFDDVLKILINNCLDLYNGKVPWSQLIIIRQLGAHYKADNYFMKVFGDEIKKLGRPASAGDRLEYLIVKDKSPDGTQLLGQRLRLPEVFVERLNTPEEDSIDTLYYLENLFKKGIEQLWQVAFKPELAELRKKYDLEDSLNIKQDMSENMRNGKEFINTLWFHFGGDTIRLIKYFEEDLPKYVNSDPQSKYVHNKYIASRRKFVSGRDVFNPRITETPIKDMIKAIGIGRFLPRRSCRSSRPHAPVAAARRQCLRWRRRPARPSPGPR